MGRAAERSPRALTGSGLMPKKNNKKKNAPPALCILDAAAGFISTALKYLCTITQTPLPLLIGVLCHSEEKPLCRWNDWWVNFMMLPGLRGGGHMLTPHCPVRATQELWNVTWEQKRSYHWNRHFWGLFQPVRESGFRSIGSQPRQPSFKSVQRILKTPTINNELTILSQTSDQTLFY